jgi:hypothetical protein
VTHAYNLSFSGGRDQHDYGSSQPRQIVHEALSWIKPSQKKVGEAARGVGPEFKPQYHKNTQTKGLGYDTRGRVVA